MTASGFRPGSTSRVTGSPSIHRRAAGSRLELTRTLFIERFGGVYEHSPWIAAAAYDAHLTSDADTAEGLAKALAAAAAKGATEQKRALIEAHPDLAGKLALAKTLTAEFDARAGERRA